MFQCLRFRFLVITGDQMNEEEETENAPLIDKESFREDIERRVMEMMGEMYRETQDQDKDRGGQHISGQDNSTSPYPPEIMEIMKNVKYTYR